MNLAIIHYYMNYVIKKGDKNENIEGQTKLI